VPPAAEKPPVEKVPDIVPATPPDASPAPKPAETSNAVPADPKSPRPVPSVSSVVPPVSDKDAPIGKPYVIGALDVLQVKVWKVSALNGIYDVGSDGMIFIPLLGAIRADGYTQAQLAAAIRDKLTEKILAQPPDINEITVEVLRYNSKKYYVYGAVNHAGEFPLLGPMTLMDVFANCGGFQPFAKTTKIYLMRGAEKHWFNFKQVSQGKKMEQNIPIQNGDRIFVRD
jgi:polysaccharide export outer membrane protein